MRTTLKLVVPLAVSVLTVSLLYGFYQVRIERRNLRNDLSHRSAVLAENLQESLESTPGPATDRNLSHFVEKYGQREHLLGVAVYDKSGTAVAITPGSFTKLRFRTTGGGACSGTQQGARRFRRREW